ncbi:sulfite exporter TauE/SafE family protein [Aquabacterium sp.]|uniref:sulfite exporter TauE/SafE family protein n=1 Tax=Aquabacterium sp. TaxID=1872578 RepID=UPI0035B105D5
MTLTLFLGLLLGAVLGLSGAGGGILAVPSLVAGMGWSMQQAAPVALIAVAGSAGLGALEGLRRGLVRYKAAILMACAGVPMTTLGQRLAALTSQHTLRMLFAIVMLFVAWRLLRTGKGQQHDSIEAGFLSDLGRINPDTGRFTWTVPTALMLAAIGATTGFTTGLLGVGGGFVMVPLLRRFTHLAMHGIVATSLLVIALVGCGGVVSALLHGAQLPMEVTLAFSGATASGMVAGRLLARKLSARRVQIGFACVLIAVAISLPWL